MTCLDTSGRLPITMGRRYTGYTALLSIWLLAVSARPDVFVFVEQANGFAWIKYECTAEEVVRAFSLDVTVDQGRILGVSDYFVG
ncbi:MAG: hypothetical protein ACR2PH_01840, partial [Desulfobulbia bacterium]